MGRVAAGEPRKTAQFSWNDDPERAGRIRAWADARNMKVAEIMRELVAAGMAKLEPEWIIECGGTVNPKLVQQYAREADRSRGVDGTAK